MNLLDDIPQRHLVALDTVAWICQVEANPIFGPVVRPFFRDRLATGLNRAGSSLIALGELLVQPMALGRTDIADRYRLFFTTDASFAVWELTRPVVETSAALRAKYRIKMVDALHLASAVVHKTDVFLTNDADLRRVTEVRVVILSDFAAP